MSQFLHGSQKLSLKQYFNVVEQFRAFTADFSAEKRALLQAVRPSAAARGGTSTPRRRKSGTHRAGRVRFADAENVLDDDNEEEAEEAEPVEADDDSDDEVAKPPSSARSRRHATAADDSDDSDFAVDARGAGGGFDGSAYAEAFPTPSSSSSSRPSLRRRGRPGRRSRGPGEDSLPATMQTVGGGSWGTALSGLAGLAHIEESSAALTEAQAYRPDFEFAFCIRGAHDWLSAEPVRMVLPVSEPEFDWTFSHAEILAVPGHGITED